jgi:hypothetical protein
MRIFNNVSMLKVFCIKYYNNYKLLITIIIAKSSLSYTSIFLILSIILVNLIDPTVLIIPILLIVLKLPILLVILIIPIILIVLNLYFCWNLDYKCICELDNSGILTIILEFWNKATANEYLHVETNTRRKHMNVQSASYNTG